MSKASVCLELLDGRILILIMTDSRAHTHTQTRRAKSSDWTSWHKILAETTLIIVNITDKKHSSAQEESGFDTERFSFSQQRRDTKKAPKSVS